MGEQKSNEIEEEKNDENQEIEEDESNIEKEIKRWGDTRDGSKSIRTLTTTLDYRTIAKAEPEFDIHKYIENGTKCLSPLGVDVTLFANYICAHPNLLDSLESTVGEYRFYRSCYDLCVGIDTNVDLGVKNAFNQFVIDTNYAIRTDLRSSYELYRRCRDAIINNELMPSTKRHLELLGITKLLDYLTLRVEQVFWLAHNKSDFKEVVEYVSRRLREHLTCEIDLKEKVLPYIKKALKEWSLSESLSVQCLNIVEDVRPYIETIKNSVPLKIPKNDVSK